MLLLDVTAHVIEASWLHIINTSQKMKFSIKDFFSKCEQIRSLLQICSQLLKKSLKDFFQSALKTFSFEIDNRKNVFTR